MKKLSRSTTVRFLLFLVLALVPNSWAQERPPILEQLAKTYGLDSYGQIEAIRYTWNAQFPGSECLPFMGLGAQDQQGFL